MSRRPGRDRLGGQVVLITGGAHGIGAGTARELAGIGAHVVIVDRDAQAAETLATALGPEHTWFAADVTDQTALDAAVTATVARFGHLDVVVAGAGVVNYGSVRVIDSDAFARTVDVNLVGLHRTVTAALPELIKSQGYVLLVGSVASIIPLPFAGGYAPSKAAVESLAGILNVELADSGVAVGIAYPCWIDTAMVRNADAVMPTFRLLRSRLPWPARSVTSPENCAQAFVTGIARRARRIYVPRSIALVSALRTVLTSGFGERVVVKQVTPVRAQLDSEVVIARDRARQPSGDRA